MRPGRRAASSGAADERARQVVQQVASWCTPPLNLRGGLVEVVVRQAGEVAGKRDGIRLPVESCGGK
ncbi:hypothetical protein NDU88_004702 [Pleurodeles waltl]|uniref:Uncharacterized protein n=1 Tax=Pleurodeles waltl TaxID=8319 RepID=A0AAV7MU76_PLEWA|nr:hypothetical protein NDU88_004702 [Pleurodeles waltl]